MILPTFNGRRDISRIQAMKEVSLKEAAIFCYVRGLDMLNWRGWGGDGDGRGKNGTSSLEMLTERESLYIRAREGFEADEAICRIYCWTEHDLSIDRFDNQPDW